MHGLESEYSDRVKFTYLDIDDPATVVFKRELGFHVQPHFFLLDGEGNILKQWFVPASAEEFVLEFEAVLGQRAEDINSSVR